MKLILIDNYARDAFADILVYENLHPWIARWMERERQAVARKGYERWPVAVPDGYRLWRGMEDMEDLV
jgi:hypothetical protein